MLTKFDKRDRAGLFRERLAQAMADKGETQSGLARRVGVDRSTISQLLGGDGARLPNAQVVAECASALAVSADWLLGLTERPEPLANLLATSLTLTEAPRALIDETIFGWHQEAAGYKVAPRPGDPARTCSRPAKCCAGNMNRSLAAAPTRPSAPARTGWNGSGGAVGLRDRPAAP